MSGFVGRLDRLQRRHPALGAPIAVIYKFFDDQGPYLGALIAFYAFMSLFPLFLLFSTVLGFALEHDPTLRDALLDSAARQIPVIGQQIETQQLRGSGTAVTVAVITAVFGSLGVAQAIQNAMNVTWGIRRNERPNPVTSRLRSLVLIATLGLFIMATTMMSQVGAVLGDRLPWFTATSAFWFTLGSYLLAVVLFLAISRLGTASHPPFRELWPGALLGGLCWQALQLGGSAFVTEVIARSSVTNAGFGVVLGLVIWLYLAGMSLVLCLELNIVRARRLYPRSLLTPMTDRVDLTEADRLAYARLVRAQSLKGFQNVEVTFDYDGQYASAHRRRRELEGPDPESLAARTLRLRDGVRRLPATIPVSADALPSWITAPRAPEDAGRANPGPPSRPAEAPVEAAGR